MRPLHLTCSRFLFASLAPVTIAATLISGCSGKDTKLQAGAVYFSLQNTADAATEGNCPELGGSSQFTISEPGTLLASDGEDGASVACTVGSTSYNVTVSKGGNSFHAAGSVTLSGTGANSSDTTVSLHLSTGNSYSNSSTVKCTVAFSQYDDNGGALNATITCPDLLNTSTGGDCALSESGSSSIFTFANCATN